MAVREWWRELVTAEPPPDNVVGLWFGLFEDARGGFTLYVHGFYEADAADAEGDWATENPTWEPEGRYVRLASLSALHAAEWDAALQRTLELLRALAPQEALPGAVSVVGAGFDDGDYCRIWPP